MAFLWELQSSRVYIILRKQPSFFAPGPSGVSREGCLRFTVNQSTKNMPNGTLHDSISSWNLVDDLSRMFLLTLLKSNDDDHRNNQPSFGERKRRGISDKNLLFPTVLQPFWQFNYNTIQYFIDTPLVGLFSDNATNKDIPIRIDYTINIITTYYPKCELSLNYNKKWILMRY